MISFITGIVEYILDNSIVLQNNGIGYLIQLSSTAIAKLPNHKEQIRVYTQMIVKEDGIWLYGFLAMDEVFMFNRLMTVSGVGAKAAMALLGTNSVQQLINAIIYSDISALSKTPGIGKKTAERIILELKDKLAKENDTIVNHDLSMDTESLQRQEAMEALTALGFSRLEAVRAVMEVTLDGMSSEQIIKAAIKKLSQ